MTKTKNRVIRAPTGTKLQAKSWLTEAPLRMIMNNLDPDVAERPDDLVVYGGIGKAARNWECFDTIIEKLRELESDETLLYARSPDRALIPASNVKILTAIAALDAFGPTHRFETSILADRLPDASGEVGDLVVRGGGDPALNSEDWWRLAADLRRAGLRRVAGDLVLDDSAFDRERWHPSWGEVSARAYHAPVGALTANYGGFALSIQPAPRPGGATRVHVDPAVPYLRIVNRVRSAAPGSRPRITVDREALQQAELVTVHGVVPSGEPPIVVYRSVLDPSRYAGAVFRMQLEANGIEVAGDTRIGPGPASLVPILTYRGRPLADVVRLFLKFSNNAIAETLVKAMGARRAGGVGSWATGVPELQRRLVKLGMGATQVSLVDGSGLSYENKVTPRALVQALGIAQRSFDFGPEFVSALPIAAMDGTLDERAEESLGEIRAKTGLLTRVTALSGFARLPSDDLAVFSILVNGYRGSDQAAMDAVDRFTAELVRPYPEDVAADSRGEETASLR